MSAGRFQPGVSGNPRGGRGPGKARLQAQRLLTDAGASPAEAGMILAASREPIVTAVLVSVLAKRLGQPAAEAATASKAT